MKPIAVVTTVANREDAHRLPRTLVERKLAACAQISEIESIYHWKGEVQQERELRVLFKTPYRDISTGLRLVRKSLVDELDLTANSPFIGAELAIKTMLKGFRVGEVGIQTFPREFGKGASVTPANIMATIRDMMSARRKIFSNEYELPINRQPGENGVPQSRLER